MPKAEQPSFTSVNYEVCNYCPHQVRAEHRDGYNEGCGLVQNAQGQYARLTFMQEELKRINEKTPGMAINSLKGCERFEANGLPAHPIVKKQLVKHNSLAAAIPEDPTATETSWNFSLKREKYPGKVIDLFRQSPDGKLQHTIR